MMADDTIGNASAGAYLFMLLVGLALAVWPLATLTNFRGYRNGHAQRVQRSGQRLRRFPPYRSWQLSSETDRRFTTATQIVVAVVFLLASAALVVTAIVGLVRRVTEG
jgi:hypothetical protein